MICKALLLLENVANVHVLVLSDATVLGHDVLSVRFHTRQQIMVMCIRYTYFIVIVFVI